MGPPCECLRQIQVKLTICQVNWWVKLFSYIHYEVYHFILLFTTPPLIKAAWVFLNKRFSLFTLARVVVCIWQMSRIPKKSHVLIIRKVIRLQRSGIDTIKYHTWPRIPMGKWQTHRRHHKREPRGQPFPSRWPQSTYKQTRTKHSKHKTEQKHKRSTKEVPPWNGQ